MQCTKEAGGELGPLAGVGNFRFDHPMWGYLFLHTVSYVSSLVCMGSKTLKLLFFLEQLVLLQRGNI